MAGAAFAPYATKVLGLFKQSSRTAQEATSGGRAILRLSAVTAVGDHVRAAADPGVS